MSEKLLLDFDPKISKALRMILEAKHISGIFMFCPEDLVKAVCCASTLAEGQTVGMLECKRRLDIGTGKLSRHRTFPVA